MLILLGAVLFGAGLRGLGRGLTPFPRPRPGARLVTRGAYGLARHPIYGGLILLAAGWSLAWTSVWVLGASAVLAAFLSLKSRREEAWLGAADPGYAAYRRRVRRRLIPWLI